MNGLRALLGLVSGLAVLVAAEVRGEVQPPEPTEYRTKDYRAPTPAGLAGAHVVTTAEAELLWQGKSAIFVDVLPHAPRPANLPRQAETGYSGKHLASRYRVRRARPSHRGLPAQQPPAGYRRRPRKTAGDLLSAGLLDVVERRQAHPVHGLRQRRLVSGRDRRLDRSAPPGHRGTAGAGGRQLNFVARQDHCSAA